VATRTFLSIFLHTVFPGGQKKIAAMDRHANAITLSSEAGSQNHGTFFLSGAQWFFAQ
jgi:hypothetical protein